MDLLKKWNSCRPASVGFFDRIVSSTDGTANLGDGLKIALDSVGATVEHGFYYGSHSPRIGAFNELDKLGLSRA